METSNMRRQILVRNAVTVGLPVILLAAGCGRLYESDQNFGFQVQNLRTGSITISIEGIESPRPVLVPPNSTLHITNDRHGTCSGNGAVAVDTQGKEIGRLHQSVCDGQTWIFAADGTTSIRNSLPE